MANRGTQKKLEKVRPPRVQITYEVETGGAIEMKELPFVMGVIADLSGQPVEPLAKIKERKFVEISLDNFDDVLASMKPHLAFTVDNKLSDAPDAGKIGVDLHFKSMEDFSPDRLVQNVEPLRKLHELRSRLADLRAEMAANAKLEDVLAETLRDAEKLAKLKDELGGGPDHG